MDIKVITRHAPSNYGSLLQSIATITTLERLGHKCEIIDYIRDDEHGLSAVKTNLNNKQRWSGNSLKKLAYIVLRYPEEKKAELNFREMRRKYLKLTQLCRTHDDLKRLDADIFMTGSDQVWGPTLNGHYDEAYFLSFVKDKRKIAYALFLHKPDSVGDQLFAKSLSPVFFIHYDIFNPRFAACGAVIDTYSQHSRNFLICQ